MRRQFESKMSVTTKSGAVLKKSVLREWELLNDDIELKMKIGTVSLGGILENCLVGTLTFEQSYLDQ